MCSGQAAARARVLLSDVGVGLLRAQWCTTHLLSRKRVQAKSGGDSMESDGCSGWIWVGEERADSLQAACWSGSVVVITSASHAEGREFEPRSDLHLLVRLDSLLLLYSGTVAVRRQARHIEPMQVDLRAGR